MQGADGKLARLCNRASSILSRPDPSQRILCRAIAVRNRQRSVPAMESMPALRRLLSFNIPIANIPEMIHALEQIRRMRGGAIRW